ncbi:MAG: hypothetical protein RXO36_07245 [Candidatus Nanopusillus acidilobi]|jgi:hypothetical protein
MLQIARAIPVHPVKFDGKTYYSIYVGDMPVWVHKSLIDNNMVILKGKRFCLDMNETPDGVINYYLYPGKNKITAIGSTKYLYISDGAWIMSNYGGTYYYLIEHEQDTLIVNNIAEIFEIRDNKIVSVERHVVHGIIDEDIDLDCEW